MPTTPVSAENDVTAGPGVHLLMLCYCPDIYECAAPMNWTPGSWAERHSLTFNVLFNKQRIVLDSHDHGPLLTHMPFVDPWRTLKSSRKTIFSAAKVKAHDIPLACVDESHPLMTCGDPISLPSAFNFTNPSHNLFIGMSELDELKGRVAIVCSIVTDIIMFCAFPPADDKSPVDQLSVEGFFGVNPKKAVVSGVANFIGSLVVSSATGWQEPVKVFSLKQGNGFAGVQSEVTYDPSTGAWQQKTSHYDFVTGKIEHKSTVYEPGDAEKSSEAARSWGEKL